MVLLRMASGVLVWALHFGVIYGATGLACARGLGETVPWTVGTATLLAAAAAGVIILTHLSQEFARWMTAALAAVALVAIVWEGLAVLTVPACD
ncbi:MAG TPA: hypothetical protein VD791_07375 [Burkholderiales bacterium]|nr:hypothetical protein [Burkholderiales bacterium]